MLGLLLLAFLVIPIIELYVFVQVADAIGFLPTLAWIVIVSVVGAWVVKHEGLQAWRRASERAAAGQVPTTELANGVMILLGGALLLTPGFFTDVLGLVLVLPPTRAALRGTVMRRFVAAGPIVVRRNTIIGGFGAPGRPPARGRDVWDAESWEDQGGPGDRPELP
ncbi:MAG TPA: FxsA family protein [Acidimicrobiales bacterium]|nr:FxsA family protein [Acidimicrobiales bacterium]